MYKGPLKVVPSLVLAKPGGNAGEHRREPAFRRLICEEHIGSPKPSSIRIAQRQWLLCHLEHSIRSSIGIGVAERAPPAVPVLLSNLLKRSLPLCAKHVEYGFTLTATFIDFSMAGPARGAGVHQGSRASGPLIASSFWVEVPYTPRHWSLHVKELEGDRGFGTGQ